jgi:malate dehydrogenase (oxaloacetate-decarboxylating)
MPIAPSASYSLTIRVQLRQEPGAFARVADVIGNAGGILGAIDLVRVDSGGVTRDVTVSCADSEHGQLVVAAIRALERVQVISISDRTFLLHKGGKIEVQGRVPIKTRDDLSMAYTPGVARISMAIHEDPAAAWALTIKRNTVAVVSDGTAVLGLGDIGPAAAMPVMEGKAMLFKEFAGVDAWPLCLDTKDPDAIVATVQAIAPASAGSTWRTSPRRAASRSSAGSRRRSTSRCSTTTSTARRSSCWPPSSTRCGSSASGRRHQGRRGGRGRGRDRLHGHHAGPRGPPHRRL